MFVNKMSNLIRFSYLILFEILKGFNVNSPGWNPG